MSETIFFWMAVSPAVLLTFFMILGDFDIDFDISSGHFDIGSGHGAGPLGLKAILAFTSGFGLGGYLAHYFEWGINPILCGLAFSIPSYLIVFIGMRLLYSQRGNSQVDSKNVVGQKARVVNIIHPKSVGEILVEDPNVKTSLYMPAVCDDKKSIEKDSIVTVESVEGGTARVKLS